MSAHARLISETEHGCAGLEDASRIEVLSNEMARRAQGWTECSSSRRLMHQSGSGESTTATAKNPVPRQSSQVRGRLKAGGKAVATFV